MTKSARARRWLKNAAFSFILLLMGYGALELVALAANCVFLSPSVSYLERYRMEASHGSLLPEEWRGRRLSHPYFGFVFDPDQGTNNMGFFDPHPFPYVKEKNEIVVGIFGGSVAMMFGRDAAAMDLLKKILVSRNPRWKGRKLTILNFAVASAKQPQQFFIFSYFSSGLDVAINLDGYNELAVEGSGYPEFPIDFPHDSRFFFKNQIRYKPRLALLSLLRDGVARMREAPLRFEPLAYSQLYYLLTTTLGRIGYGVQLREADVFARDDEGGKFRMTTGTRLAGDQMIQKGVDIWARYTRMESDLAKAEGISSFFFIQPNQYVPGSKVLSVDEKNKAYTGSRHDIELGYSELLKQVTVLRRKGVRLWSLVDVYRDNPDTIYVDTCCHVNATGNAILAEAIGGDLAGAAAGR